MLDLPPIFPAGRRAAVSLTYDDGLAQHLDVAIPELEAAGLRGTFFVPLRSSECWASRTDEWGAAAARGHEIGNHTLHHPCSISHPWVKPNFSLEAYNLARMESELLEASREIESVTRLPMKRQAYAYTCCEEWVGVERVSYRPLVARLFAAARGGGEREPADPRGVDLHSVPARIVAASDSERDLLAYLDDAIERARWAVFVFHGVGGGHSLNASRATHRALCKRIVASSDVLWCGTFAKVAEQLASS